MTTNWEILRASVESMRDNSQRYAKAAPHPLEQDWNWAQAEVLQVVLDEMTTIEARDGI